MADELQIFDLYNLAEDRSISLKFGFEFDHVAGDTRSKVKKKTKDVKVT